jgi:ZIP family zinc transporter
MRAMAIEPVLVVLLSSAAAAAVSALGALPFIRRETVPASWLGYSYALASGAMLGVGYLLIAEGLRRAGLPVVLGGGVGVAYTYWTHVYSGTHEMDMIPGDELPAGEGYKVLLLNALHSGSEGVAIGIAMVVSLRLGVAVAIALAIHNIGEAMGLTAVLRARGAKVGHAAGLAVITKTTQLLMAVVAFAIAPAGPDLVPAILGFASGTLVFLTMTELLPSAYKRAPRGGLAVTVSLATGAVALLHTFLLAG